MVMKANDDTGANFNKTEEKKMRAFHCLSDLNDASICATSRENLSSWFHTRLDSKRSIHLVDIEMLLPYLSKEHQRRSSDCVDAMANLLFCCSVYMHKKSFHIMRLIFGFHGPLGKPCGD